MTHAVDLPMWAALPVAMLVLLGAALTFTGSIVAFASERSGA